MAWVVLSTHNPRAPGFDPKLGQLSVWSLCVCSNDMFSLSHVLKTPKQHFPTR